MLDFIFDHINIPLYQELLMFDLPKILQSPKISINQFFSRNAGEITSANMTGGCNMENAFTEL